MPNVNANASPKRLRVLRAQAKTIAVRRCVRGLTQPQAAAELGVSVETYRSWEYGKRQPPPEIRAHLIEEWGCAAQALAYSLGACPCCGRPY